MQMAPRPSESTVIEQLAAGGQFSPSMAISIAAGDRTGSYHRRGAKVAEPMFRTSGGFVRRLALCVHLLDALQVRHPKFIRHPGRRRNQSMSQRFLYDLTPAGFPRGLASSESSGDVQPRQNIAPAL